MISNETEERVARLLLVLAEGERGVEISRQVLSDNFDFDPFQIFAYLDVDGKNRICSGDILNYLRNKGTFATPNEAELIILFYDQDGDGLLSFSEFLNMIKSVKSIKKRTETNASGELSFNIDYSLTKLLEKEIEFSRKVIPLLEDLQFRTDFNIHAIFHLIAGCHAIFSCEVKEFLEANNASYLESDIINIMRRLDLNRDGRVDLCEIHALLGFPNFMVCSNHCSCGCCTCCGNINCCSICCPHHHHHHHHVCHCGCSPCRSRSASGSPSPLRNSQSRSPRGNYSPRGGNDNELRRISPNLSLRRSPERQYSPRRRSPSPNMNSSMNNNFNDNFNPQGSRMDNKEITKISPNLALRRSPERHYSPNRSRSPSPPIEQIPMNDNYNPQGSRMNNNESTQISPSLALRKSPERKYSPRRNNSPSPPPMNEAPINQEINNENPNGVNDNQIRRISPNLSLRRSPERKFSPNGNKSLSPDNDQMQNNPQGNNLSNSNNNLRSFKPNEPIPGEEKETFLNYLMKVMSMEGAIEKNKINLADKNDFNVEDAFRIFELDGRGYLTEEDIDYGLNQLEVPHTESDVRLLMKRFDNQKQGVINFGDFFDIVTPFEKDYRNIVEIRPPNSCCACRCPGVFSVPTRVYLKNLFTMIIESERRLNEDRKEMVMTRARMPGIFKEMDRFNYGYFREDDLGEYLKSNHALSSGKEKDLLFIRLDKNRNGKVEKYEVDDEIKPIY
ncbi:MAG: EF-hand domain-containing protein [archaeon]|nr:EF-hand domain-containing protein [archaeon]